MIAGFVVMMLVIFSRGKLSSPFAEALLHLGCLIIWGYILGRLLEDISAPGVIGFALVGFVLGPEVIHLIGDDGGSLRTFGMIFLGWVGFCVGARFRLDAGHLNRKAVGIAACFVLVTALFAMIVWGVSGFSIYIVFLVAIVICLPDPFWVFAATSEAPKRTREKLLCTVGILGMIMACLCWAIGTGAVRRSSGASLGHTMEPMGQLLLSVAAGFLWGEAIYHLCGILKARSAVLTVFLISLLGVIVASHFFPVSLMIIAVSSGVWTANRGAKAEFIVQAIRPIGYLLAGPLFAIFGTQIPVGALIARITWPIGLMYVGTMVVGRMGASVLAVRCCKDPGVSARYLSSGMLLQGVVLLEMVRWTYAILAGNKAFGETSELFLALAGVGMVCGTFLLPIWTAVVWYVERRK